MESKEVRQWQDAKALERFQIITPLLDETKDEAWKVQERAKIAEKYGISTRTIYRYEQKYREAAFEGLRPMNRKQRRSQKLPDNFDEIVAQAIQLKKEVPKRSVRQIIKILELEGWAPPGVLKPSTMQRYLYNAGFGKKQMKKYAEGKATSSRRFCRAHRMELVQGDVKYGPDIRLKDGGLIRTYLSSLIDDHSRYILHSEFYDNQREEVIEDTFHKAILKFGVFDCTYLDNGKQYTADHIHSACARLGIKVLHAKPYACESKGKIERFHQKVDQFIAELRVDPVHDLESLNERWKYFLELEYQKEKHEGIAEYYRSYGTDIPECGITPLQEFQRDERNLKFLDVSVVSEAFLHHEERVLDNAGCFSFENQMYEASTALANAKVEIVYDPMDTERIRVDYQGMKPITAKRIVIGAYADGKPPVPIAMTDELPENSRLLAVLEKKYKEDHQLMANALSFGDYGKDGGGNV